MKKRRNEIEKSIIEVRSTKINPNHQSFSQLSVCCTDCNNNGRIRSSLFIKIYVLNIWKTRRRQGKRNRRKNEKKNDPRGYKSIIIKKRRSSYKKITIKTESHSCTCLNFGKTSKLELISTYKKGINKARREREKDKWNIHKKMRIECIKKIFCIPSTNRTPARYSHAFFHVSLKRFFLFGL